jgi:hypothetical protein
MTVRLVADIQNRLFWRVGTGQVLSAALPLKAPWTGSGWCGYSYGGFGEDTRTSARIPAAGDPISVTGQVSAGLASGQGPAYRVEPCQGSAPSDSCWPIGVSQTETWAGSKA